MPLGTSFLFSDPAAALPCQAWPAGTYLSNHIEIGKRLQSIDTRCVRINRFKTRIIKYIHFSGRIFF